MLIRKQVEQILDKNYQARNNDRVLILEVWEQEGLFLNPQQHSKFMEVSSAETIRRTRQKLQEEGRYPADERVKTIRKDLAKQTSQEMVADKLFDERAMKAMRRMF